MLLFLFVTGAHSQAQQESKPSDCPMMKKSGMDEMNERGNQGMGFSQEKTTHHFYLTKTGGIIEVRAKDPQDTESIGQIRQHLKHIAAMFAAGNFEIPMFVHDKMPAGVPEMKSLKSSISYIYEESPGGARLRITSDNPQAIAAVRSFLRFQITEHKTGCKSSDHLPKCLT